MGAGLDRDVALLCNPSAGGGRAATRPAARRARAERASACAFTPSSRASLEHGCELARTAAAAGEATVTLSGDGLIGCVVGALRDVPGAVLGILPGGRGNDTARDARASRIATSRAPARSSPAACRASSTSATSRAARSSGSPRWASTPTPTGSPTPPRRGWAVSSTSTARCARSPPGGPPASSCSSTASRSPHPATRWRPATPAATAAGCCIAPDAALDDGLLDVVLIAAHSKRALSREPAAGLQGRARRPSRRCASCARRELRVDADRPFTVYADGDPIGDTPLTIRVIPRAVRVLVPGMMLARQDRASRAPRARCPSAPAAAATSLPGKLLMRLRAGRDRRARAAPAARQRGHLGHERQDDDRRDGRRRSSSARARASCTTAPGRTWPAAWRACCSARRAARTGSTATPGSSRSTSSGSAASCPSWRRARCCWPTSSATSSTATASWRRSPTAGRRPSPPRRPRSSCSTPTTRSSPTSAARAEAARQYFGVQDDAVALRGMQHASDSKHCRRCGALLTSTRRSTSATSAATTAPAATPSARSPGLRRRRRARRHARRALRAARRRRAGDVALPLPGLYNVYNALGAAALASALGAPLDDVVAGLEPSAPPSGAPRPCGWATATSRSCSSRTRPAPTRSCARSRWSPASTTCSRCSTTTSPTAATSAGSGTRTSRCSPRACGA